MDSSLFAAVVRVAADSNVGVHLLVDPRPLKDAEPNGVHGPAFDDAAAITELRRATLARMGVDVGNATVPAHCTGVLLPDMHGNDKADCPAKRLLLIAVGQPRSSSRFAPPGVVDYAAVRVPEITLDPDGFSITNFEYVMAKRLGSWTLASRRAVSIVE